MSCSINNILIAKSITLDDPNCLYCNELCTVNVQSEWHVSTQSFTDIIVFSCASCGEKFKIYDEYVRSFLFTCKDLMVHIFYETENFNIGMINSKLIQSDSAAWINNLDNVNFDFSDKEKMYKKLKNYLIFS